MRIFPALAKAGTVDVDNPGIDRLDAFIIEAKPSHAGKPDIVEEDVGVLEQLDDHRLVILLLGVEGDRFLVAVERGEDRAEVAGRAVPGMAHHVAAKLALAIFHLDHIGAKIGKVQGGEGAQHNGRHVDDFQALERTRRFRIPLQFRPAAHHHPQIE